MEIEAKFAVPDRTIYRQLARLRSLAHFTLHPTRVSQIADRYFDTADGRLRAGGFACRLRAEGEMIVATLKGLGGATAAVHRRAEEEVRLAAWMPDPTAWPESPARTLALELTAGAPLLPLFDLAQRRARADLLEGERCVAELSLDAVHVDLTGLRRPIKPSYYELEIELAPAGHEADLAAIVTELTDKWALRGESRSKYERALELLRRHQAAEALMLTPEERRALEAHAAAGTAPFGRRAAAVLGWEDGLPTAEIARRVGLSAGRVRYWTRAFRVNRLGIFAAAAPSPAAAAAASPLPATTAQTPTGGAPAAPPSAAGSQQPIDTASAGVRTVKQLAAAHGVDLPHARRVADHAGVLFDALRTIHKLPKKQRRLLRCAALLNTVGATSSPARPHAAGRDIILAAPLQELSTVERLALACIVALGEGKLRNDREPTMTALDDKLRRAVMPLAALVRLAEALDESRTQSTEILAFTGVDSPRCEVALAGPAADRDAAQANRQAGAWRQLFKHELVFVGPAASAAAAPSAAGEAAERAPQPVVPAAIPPLAADDPMSEAGRKVLALHFNRMLANEAGTRLGEDPEALHDMRVATRRMRAAFALFEPYYNAQVIGPLGKGLRRTGRTLGAVRDLDVLLEKARSYAATLPAEAAGIEPLLLAWEADRDLARRKMITYLDGSGYRKFVAEFAAFLATPGAGAVDVPADAAIPVQARHVIPRLILTRYASVRAYERLLPGPAVALTTYHALRIECKGLRYALEFFREVLGEEAPALIKQVTALQDLLGELQDACVAEGLLAGFLAERRRALRKGAAADDLIGIETYLAMQHARQADLLAAFPAPWAELVGPEFRRRLALAIAAI